MEDDKIIELFFERSEQAIKELSNKHGHICERVANNILNNRSDSEECVNDAYLGVWNTSGKYIKKPAGCGGMRK